MSSSSVRLNQALAQCTSNPSPCPDRRKLTQLLNDVTHKEKVSILKRHSTLHKAAESGDTEIITTILSSVPQLHRLDVLLRYDYTPLHHAAHRGKSDSVETILTHLTAEQQLKVLSKRSYGQTPAAQASQEGPKTIVKILRKYQQRAEQQINAARKADNKNPAPSLTRELQQTRAQLDIQAKNIQTLISAVTAQQTDLRDSQVPDNEQQGEQILQQQINISNLQAKTTNLCDAVDELRATGDARGKQHQDDITNQKHHYETKLTEQQEQITHQQEQIAQLRDEMTATVAVRNMAMSNLNDRVEVLGPTCTNLRDDVDRIDETVERIDEQFYPESNAVGRGVPHDGGDEVIVQVIEQQLTVPQPATNA